MSRNPYYGRGPLVSKGTMHGIRYAALAVQGFHLAVWRQNDRIAITWISPDPAHPAPLTPLPVESASTDRR